jgi:hydrogenase nickel incorporation protein HypA/HybF
MHELSIAMSIVEICTEEVQKASASKVTKVEVEIGSLAGVETEALEFSWDVAINNTVVEDAPLVIKKIIARAKCRECQSEFDIENYFSPCPSCGAFGYEVVQGKELQVKAITIE